MTEQKDTYALIMESGKVKNMDTHDIVIVMAFLNNDLNTAGRGTDMPVTLLKNGKPLIDSGLSTKTYQWGQMSQKLNTELMEKIRIETERIIAGEIRMTPTQLRKLIDLKYGKGGQTRFAAAICVHVTTVQKWLAGKHRINPLVKGHFDV